ncbi:MAG: hypothetical protein SWZ49_29055 [Cyanobacteriota bacterium]|nr:hypothetical protein [Cyanobacteriota bacterium]
MNRQKQHNRLNISIRLQPYEGSLLAKIAQWLKEMPIDEKNNLVSHLLVMTCLPLAQAETGADQNEVEKYYWEFEKWVHLYRLTLRERLNIQGEFHSPNESKTAFSDPITVVQKKEEAEVTSLDSQLINEGSVKAAASIFDNM